MPVIITTTTRYLITNPNSKFHGKVLDLNPMKNDSDFLISSERYNGSWLYYHKDNEVKLVSTTKKMELKREHGVKFELIGITVDMTEFDDKKTNAGWYALVKSDLFPGLQNRSTESTYKKPYMMDNFYSKLVNGHTKSFNELKEMFGVYKTKEQMCTYEGFAGILNHPNNSALAMNKYGVTRLDIDTVKSDFYVVYISQA